MKIPQQVLVTMSSECVFLTTNMVNFVYGDSRKGNLSLREFGSPSKMETTKRKKTASPESELETISKSSKGRLGEESDRIFLVGDSSFLCKKATI